MINHRDNPENAVAARRAKHPPAAAATHDRHIDIVTMATRRRAPIGLSGFHLRVTVCGSTTLAGLLLLL
jgi:hypothetical protein